MKALYYILFFAAFFTLSGCGSDDECVITCEIEGLGNKGIELMYADRGVKRLSFHPVDGKVEMRVNLPRPALIEAFTLGNTRLFSIIGQNGDEISVKMKLDDPASLKVEGNEPSASYARITAANDSLLKKGTEDEVNALITREIHAAPSSMASTMLLINFFNTAGHELQADSLLNTISADARPTWLSGSFASTLGSQLSAMVKNEVPSISIHTGSDTMVRFNPSLQSYNLLVLSDRRKPDSITKRLRSLRKDLKQRRLGILEVSIATDTATWKETISADSARWQQAWVPGGAGNQQIRNLAVPKVPYFIVADSSGKYVYRGQSLYTADTLIRSRLNFKNEVPAADPDTTASTPPQNAEKPAIEQPGALKLRKTAADKNLQRRG